MAQNMSDYLENNLLSHLFRLENAAFRPSQLWIGLSMAAPGEDGSGIDEPPATDSQPQATAYARVRIDGNGVGANNKFGTGAVSGGSITNTAEILFPTATGHWTEGADEITHFFISDASTAGNMLWYGPVNTPKAITDGDTVSFPTSAITVTMQ